MLKDRYSKDPFPLLSPERALMQQNDQKDRLGLDVLHYPPVQSALFCQHIVRLQKPLHLDSLIGPICPGAGTNRQELLVACSNLLLSLWFII